MEPTPPCGTVLAVKLTGECVPCRSGVANREDTTTVVASTIVMQQHPLINISSFLGSFLGTIAAFVVIGCIGIIAYIIFRKCTRGPSVYNKLSSTGSLWEQQIKRKDAVPNVISFIQLFITRAVCSCTPKVSFFFSFLQYSQ